MIRYVPIDDDPKPEPPIEFLEALLAGDLVVGPETASPEPAGATISGSDDPEHPPKIHP